MAAVKVFLSGEYGVGGVMVPFDGGRSCGVGVSCDLGGNPSCVESVGGAEWECCC